MQPWRAAQVARASSGQGAARRREGAERWGVVGSDRGGGEYITMRLMSAL